MTVIINELEQLPAGGTAPPDARRGGGNESPQQVGSRGVQPAQLIAMICREASRQARLWAD